MVSGSVISENPRQILSFICRVRKTPSPPERDTARKISSSPVHSDKVLDSGYTSVRINGVHSTTALGEFILCDLVTCEILT